MSAAATDTGNAAGQAAPSPEAMRRRERLLDRLGARPYSPGLWGWLVPALMAALAAALRFTGIGNPHQLIFDETYYAKDAYALLQAGYELVWPEEADEDFLAGNPQPSQEGAYVVHPPLGKWLIAVGIRLFGTETALGWRFSSAVAGTLGVLLVALIAQRMFRSVFLGGVAGVLTAVEGHHLVMSRVALLDIFLMLCVLGAFGALMADRYQGRRRLAAWAAEQDPNRDAMGPVPWWRPWRLTAGVLLGCAVAVKLSGLAFLAVFGLMVLLWDAQARRLVGVRRWVRAALVRDAVPSAVTVLPLAAAAYAASWSGWFAGSGGWGRTWHLENPAQGLAQLVPGPLRSLWNYHTSAADFHTGLDAGHEYASHPWTWVFMGRPVSMHYQGLSFGEDYEHTGEVCQAESCSSAILDVANPVIWWAGVIALVMVLLLWCGRRDWRWGAILTGFAAGWAVWLAFPERTTFFFYTISFHPFVMLAVTAAAAMVLRAGTAPADAAGRIRSAAEIISARQRNTVLVLCFVLLSVAASVFFWPLWTAELIPYDQWRLRMWMQSWI
ncbi:phospholipid carrier-dependent glycosyltransferase [Nesterenkonia sp.]|uniref:dolichyl-phosphate-mannose--protein mannosyltransferase n=1 Tax=Nesterenkonia sp. TaxID=704201 RepID=UPI00260CAFA1|nr:phospholipid carrier-dependent glycosyltransferase [Nesterenkonia sp.]